MQERWLHWAWERKLIQGVDGIQIIDPGKANLTKPGPDFLFASVAFDGLRWYGHVEIHINSSEWYKHRHNLDPHYDNVILHVVANNDTPVKIHHQPLKTLVVNPALVQHLKGFNQRPFASLPCAPLCKTKPVAFSFAYLMSFWNQRMRRKQKETTWEMILTQHLFLGHPLEHIGLLNKRQRPSTLILHAINELKTSGRTFDFSRGLTSQLLSFMDVLAKSRLTVFEQTNVMLNGVIPYVFSSENAGDLIAIAETIKPERNKIISLFNGIGIRCHNGFESQAILEIYRDLCHHKRCLTCEIGVNALTNEKKPAKVNLLL